PRGHPASPRSPGPWSSPQWSAATPRGGLSSSSSLLLTDLGVDLANLTGAITLELVQFNCHGVDNQLAGQMAFGPKADLNGAGLLAKLLLQGLHDRGRALLVLEPGRLARFSLAERVRVARLTVRGGLALLNADPVHLGVDLDQVVLGLGRVEDAANTADGGRHHKEDQQHEADVDEGDHVHV